MFEHIHFLSISKEYKNQDMVQDEAYQTFARSNDMADLKRWEFLVDGSSKYILSHPLTNEKKEKLIYIQSFSYMDNGEKYFTDRQGYRSFLIIYTYEGSGCITYEGKTYELFPGDGALVDCRKPHQYKTLKKRWVHGDLHFWGGNSETMYFGLFENRPSIFHISRTASWQNMLEDILREQTTSTMGRDYLISMKMNELLNYAYSDMAKQSGIEIPDNIRLLQQYIEQHFLDNITIDAMAKLACTSKFHLIRQFRQYTGFTPHQYILHLKMSQAENLLVNTNYPVFRVGIMSGFPTESNFLSLFRKYHNVTPSEYRRNSI